MLRFGLCLWNKTSLQAKREEVRTCGTGPLLHLPAASGAHLDAAFKKTGAAFTFKRVGIKVEKWEGQGAF